MKQDFFEKVPSEITVNILSRLPVRTVVCCKCVSKLWLNLLGTRDFVKYHLSKSVPLLLINEHLMNDHRELSKLYKIVEFEDGLDLEDHELHYKPVTNFTLPHHGKIYGSVNGLYFLRDKSIQPDGLFICNPITRDYIKLHCPQEFALNSGKQDVVAYGFGVSKISDEYKVVRIYQECHKEEGIGQFKISIPWCNVYTLGTGSWRIITPRCPPYLYGYSDFLATRNSGTFLNGKLYWRAIDLSGYLRISCFDLETETFYGITTPLLFCQGSLGGTAGLCAFSDSLCLCDDNGSSPDQIVIWLMKENGDEKFWVKIISFRKDPELFFPFRFMIGLIFPIKHFKDGDMLFEWDGCFLFRYSEKEKDKLKPFDMICSWHEAIIHTPSFLSLKSFDKENVSTF